MRACVIGDPIAHSRSPLVHGYWLDQLGLDGSYEKRRVAADELDDFLSEVRSGAFAGANVTVPHKEAVAARVDRKTPTAARLGAVNTIWMEDGELWGDNTDVAGFIGNLDEVAPSWSARKSLAIVLGAGGAARAAVHGLADRGFENIAIINRSLSRAQALAAHFSDAQTTVSAHPWSDIEALMPRARLLTNTTSLGMSGQPELEVDLQLLAADAVVYDIVYVPLETALLRQARKRGLVAVDGLGMLLHQAAPGFERWFGVRPSVTPRLRQLLVNDVTGGASAS